MIAPCAPSRDAGPEWQCESFQWFQYGEDGIRLEEWQQAQLRAQRSRLLGLLEEELQRLPNSGSLLVAGLSQGASMALDMVLHFNPREPSLRQRLRGALAQRGILQPESIRDLAARGADEPRLDSLVVLATHGSLDEYVDVNDAFRSYDFLHERGAHLQKRCIEGLEHTGYCKEESECMTEFIYQTLHHGAKRHRQ